MFKTLFLSFISVSLLTSISYAGECKPGQYQNDTAPDGCSPCGKGKYSTEPNSRSCKDCVAPSISYGAPELMSIPFPVEFTKEEGEDTDECAWSITVEKGKKLTLNEYSLKFEQKDCDTGYTSDERTVNGTGYAYNDKLENLQRCDQREIYTITLTAIDPDDPSNEDTRTLYVKYGVGFSEDKNFTDWSTGIDHGILPTFPAESSWWLNETSIFSGYYNEETMIIDGSGGTRVGNDQIKSDIKAEAKFYNAVQYTVNYKYNDEPDGTETQSCYYVREGRKCTAKNFNNSKYSLGNKVFAAWCLEKSGNTCTKRIEVGGDIPRPKKPSVIGNLDKQSVTLTPILEDCPAGYYCQAGNKTACPGGTTSDKGSSSINDCYLKGGVTQMCGVFNGKTQCATLDSGTDRIYY